MAVLEEMFPYLSSEFGNPGSVYDLGTRARAAVDRARKQVAAFLNAESESQVIFTAGGSDGNSMLFKNPMLMRHGGKHIVISGAEHDSVFRAARKFDGAFKVTYLPVNSDGTIRLKDLEKAVQKKGTALVSVMYVNNELDGVNNVKEIAEICHHFGVLFHTDAVQAAGTHPIDVQEFGCDFLTISGHKIHGPKGVGALYARDKSILSVHVFGGEKQEYGLRSGTENVPGIVGLGKACELVTESGGAFFRTIPVLKRVFLAKLIEHLTAKQLDHIFHINSGFNPVKPVTGKTLSIRFDGVDSETLILMLSAAGVYVSAGSACHGDSTKPSRVLLASGLTPAEAHNTIRVSFSRDNTLEDVKKAAEIFANCVELIVRQHP